MLTRLAICTHKESFLLTKQGICQAVLMIQIEKAERVMIVFTTDAAREDIGIAMIVGTMYMTMTKEDLEHCKQCCRFYASEF